MNASYLSFVLAGLLLPSVLWGASKPAAPSNLSTTSLSARTIHLAWKDNSSNEQQFYIERTTNNFVGIAQFIVGVNVTNYTDTNLNSSTRYSYRVRARNSAGYSKYSNTNSATTLAAAAPAAPSELTVAALNSSQMQLLWRDNSTDETQFNIERSTNGFLTTVPFSVSANVTNFIDVNLQPSTTYSYRVRASNSGGLSGYSNTNTATTAPPTPPNPPSSLSATPLATTQARLNWSDTSTDETEFRIERSINGFTSTVQFIAVANTTTFTDTNVLPGIRYEYRVRACNGVACSAFSPAAATATGSFSAWAALFQGIEHATGETAIGVAPRQVAHMLRIDLTAPGVQVTTTPRHPAYVADVQETVGQVTSHFLINNGVQAAINGQWFTPCCTGSDGTANDVWGLAVSSNVVVSPQSANTFSTTLWFATNNEPTMVGTNWPPMDTSNLWMAVSGKNPLLYRGAYVGTNVSVAPRTAIGRSSDKRYLFLLTIDGRQTGYSDGASDRDTAAWFEQAGAFDALMLDGGGSTTMVVSDNVGGASIVNRPYHNNVAGTERAVGNHVGIYARPLPGAPVLVAKAEAAKATVSPPLLDLTPTIAVTRVAAGFRIAVHGQPDYTYRIQSTTDLDHVEWQTIAIGNADESGRVEILHEGTGSRFYRAVHP